MPRARRSHRLSRSFRVDSSIEKRHSVVLQDSGDFSVLSADRLLHLSSQRVITTPDAPEHDELERQVIEHCAGRLAGFKVPRAVYVVDEFPLGTLDKLLKNKLRDLADEQPAID